jgi:hypothetical protein
LLKKPKIGGKGPQAKYFGNVAALPALESQEASSDEQAA